MTLKDGLLNGIAMTTGESKTLLLIAIGRTSCTKENAMNTITGDLRVGYRVQYTEENIKRTHIGYGDGLETFSHNLNNSFM